MSEEQLDNIVNMNQLDEDAQKILEKLYAQNNDLLTTINFKILSGKFTASLTFEELSRIVCDPRFQENIINLNDDRYNLFLKLKEFFLSNKNWITGCNLIVKVLNNSQYSELSSAVSERASKQTLKNYFSFINQDKNYFGITTIEQLENFEQLRGDVCDAILRNPENAENLSNLLEEMSTQDRLKFAIIEKNFGISLSQAKLLCQKYAFNIENTQEIIGNEKVHYILKKLSEIITADSVEQIRQIDLTNTGIRNFNDIDAEIRDSFAQMYNKSFYKPQDNDIIGTVEINGKQVTIYNPGTNFNICAHVVGFSKNTNEEEINYQEAWNSPTRVNHVICTRMVSNECLETASEKCICYGFTNFDESTLIASAPWNMMTISETSEFDTIGAMDEGKVMTAGQGSGSRFLTPMEQANNTGIDRSETNWDRFDQNGKRKQPAYITYIAESLSNNLYKANPIYQKSLLVASQYGIPLVLIDRQSVIENEHIEIENMINEYEKTRNPNLINRIIQRFQNNRTTGNNQSSEQTYKTQFPLKHSKQYLSLEDLIEKLIGLSKESENPVQAYQQMIDELLVQTTRSYDEEKDLCDIIYRIYDLDSNLIVDMDKVLQQRIGITTNNTEPRKISQSYMRTFYYKREAMRKQEESQKQFSGKTLEEGLMAIASQAKLSDFNETSQTIKSNVEKVNGQEVNNERMGYE